MITNLQGCSSHAACILCGRLYLEPAQLRHHLVSEHACRENITLLLQMGYAAVRPPLRPATADTAAFSSPVYQSTPNAHQAFTIQPQHLDDSYLDLARPSPAASSCSTPNSSCPAVPDSKGYSSSSGYSSSEDIGKPQSEPLPLSCLIDDYVDAVLCHTTPTANDEELLRPQPSPDVNPQIFSPSSTPTYDVVWTPETFSHHGSSKYPVPEDLRAAIVAANPRNRIQFVASQRLNLQMILDGFLLNKKKGPRVTRQGRTINWRCAHAARFRKCVGMRCASILRPSSRAFSDLLFEASCIGRSL